MSVVADPGGNARARPADAGLIAAEPAGVQKRLSAVHAGCGGAFARRQLQGATEAEIERGSA